MMHAGIAGSGIMGRLLALALHNAGWQVTLFEQNEQDDINCSAAAAGLLTPISELDKAEQLIFRLGQESIRTHWPHILQQLSETVYFQQSGSLVLSHPRDNAEWHYFCRRISSQLDPSRSYYQVLNSVGISQLEPDLAKFDKAYYFPDEAHIDCQEFLIQLKNFFGAQGIRCFMSTRVVALESRKIITPNQTHCFDMAFDCRGLGAQAVFTDLRALRGELIWLYAPDVRLSRPVRLLHPRYSVYVVPRPGNIYLVGASELETDDSSAISVRTALELLTAAYYIHAGFAEARILKTITHCRPTLSNHLPRIQYKEGLIAVNGLYRHGYLIAPSLAEEILRGLKIKSQQRQYPEIWESDDDHHLFQ